MGQIFLISKATYFTSYVDDNALFVVRVNIADVAKFRGNRRNPFTLLFE